MVHISRVRKDSVAFPPKLLNRVDTLDLEEPQDHDFYSSVYGSRFAAEDLPTDEMPEKEMPKEVAYRMIKDELSLDGNPMLKYVLALVILFICRVLLADLDDAYSLASFVTTYMVRIELA